IGVLHGQPDRRGIGAVRDDEIKLELASVAVVDDVDTLVHIRESDAAVKPKIRAGANSRSRSTEKIDVSREAIRWIRLSSAITTDETDAEHIERVRSFACRIGYAILAQRPDKSFARGDFDVVTCATGVELGVRRCIAASCSKGQRQLCE